MYLNFYAVSALPKTACSAQTHKSISFIWLVWSTLYVYLWFTPLIYSLWHKWASLLYVATLHFNLCTYKKYAQSSRPKVTRKWEKSTLKISGDSRITQQKISFSFKINPRPIQIALSIFFWKGIFYKCTFLHSKEADICT